MRNIHSSTNIRDQHSGQVPGSIGINDISDDLYEESHATQCGDNFVSDENTHDKSHDNMDNTNDGHFEKLMRDAKVPLYPNCKKFFKLEYLIKLLHGKILLDWSQKSFEHVLNLINEALSDGKKLSK